MPAPRFFCDDHLWRLARWLQAAGIDVAWERAIPDGALVARARAEERTILTLDRGIAARRGVDVCLLPSHDPPEQLRFVRRRFGLDLLADAFTRCPACNAALAEVDADAVSVPARVRARNARFWRCVGCGRVYWRGDHVAQLRERFRNASTES